MKILLSILVTLLVLFLVSCSKVDTGNISKKELESLANKYGGIYIFNKKYYNEIEKRERERKELKEKLGDSIKIRLSSKVSKVNMKPIDEKLPQILSNGKRYYLRWTEYKGALSYDYGSYIKRIENFIGQENLNKYRPNIMPGYFYVDDDKKIIPIGFGVGYSYQTTKFGLFGDEGRGIKFTNTDTHYIKNSNKFYMQDLEN